MTYLHKYILYYRDEKMTDQILNNFEEAKTRPLYEIVENRRGTKVTT